MVGLQQVDNGVVDLVFVDGRDAVMAAQTLAYAALFTDAENTEVADRFNRRGWWEDPQAGSSLWWLRTQPLSADVRREAVAMVQETLAIHAPALLDVGVTELSTAKNVSSVIVAIAGSYNGVEFLFKEGL
jgi:phage gp46-like protein